MLGRIN